MGLSDFGVITFPTGKEKNGITIKEPVKMNLTQVCVAKSYMNFLISVLTEMMYMFFAFIKR